jgi:very-short-patch-repair endonuclease
MTSIDASGPDAVLRGIADGQHGVFTRSQAISAGFTRRQVTARLASGIWSTLHAGVLAATTTQLSRASHAVAGRLYCAPQAWFSHATAARLLGVDPLIVTPHVWVTVPIDVVRRPRPGLIVTRSRRIDGYTTVAHGQPTLDAARTVVDMSQLLDRDALRRVMYDAVGRNVVTAQQVLAAAEDFGGRAGIALLRRVIDEFEDTFDSALEAEADERFRAAGLVFDRQVEVWDGSFLVGRLDFADEDLRLGIEIDGASFHAGREAQRRDRLRDRELRRLGWEITRFGTDDVRRCWRAMITHVEALVAQAMAAQRRPA